MAFLTYDHEYITIGGAVREDYLISMLGCQMVFAFAVRECEMPSKVLEVRDARGTPMGTRPRWAHQPLDQGNGLGQIQS